jgi:hypothetical protein
MATVTIKFRDGKKDLTLEDRGAPGGSYAQSVRYESGFVVVTDAYGGQRAFPTDLIAEMKIDSERRGGW